jgi:CBS domain-containing protein
MTVGVATCPPDATVEQIVRLILEKNLEAVVVLDPEEGHALGVVGQDELVKAYVLPEARTLTAAQVMTEGVPQCPADIPVSVAAQLMRDLGVRVLYIMHHAGGVIYPAGVLSYRHLLRHLAAENEADLRDLGLSAERKTPIEVFLERRDAARKKNLGQ